MNEQTIQALLQWEVIQEGDSKYVKVPYEAFLRESVEVKEPDRTVDYSTYPVWNATADIIEEQKPTIAIPVEISKMYDSQDKCLEEVLEYLHVIANCWQFKNSAFQSSLLKKAAALKPSLNTWVWKLYGKDGDKYLTALVKNNLEYIKSCWEKDSSK